MTLISNWTQSVCMGKGDGEDAFGKRHRSDGTHNIGDSMPGTIGDSEGVLHDQSGFTPISEAGVEKNTVSETGEEVTEDGGESVEELVQKIQI